MLMLIFTDLSLFTHSPTFLIFHISNISLSSEKDMKQLQYKGKIIARQFGLCVYFVNGMYGYCVEAYCWFSGSLLVIPSARIFSCY